MYDETAPGYDELHGQEQRAKLELIKKAVRIDPDTTILDIGCGTGLSAMLGGRITGIEPSAQMRVQAPFETVAGSAEKLPFPDKSFDIALCVTAIHHADVDQALSEMRRVARQLIIISALRKARLAEIETKIREKLSVQQTIEEAHDRIFICSP